MNDTTGAEKPRLLDAFCGAGGATRGYQLAGWHVTGVDIAPQPNYCGDEFVQGDALDFIRDHGNDFHAIHASPPCQQFTAYRRRGSGVGDGYADLIAQTRAALMGSRRRYVIENVAGAPLMSPTILCGSMFGLDVRRHRYFESDSEITFGPCSHELQASGRFPGATNRAPMSRATVEVGVWRIPLDVQKRAMGIDWPITLRELSEAVPPAYTEHIGRRLSQAMFRGDCPIRGVCWMSKRRCDWCPGLSFSESARLSERVS